MNSPALSVLFAEATAGQPEARERLFVALYGELKRIAAREVARSGAELGISPTTLLHEAWIDLAGRSGLAFPDRPRFIVYAARAMRGLVVDFVRERRALKRGGAFHITRLDTAMGEGLAKHVDTALELEQLDAALDALAAEQPALAELVDLKYFCGFSLREIAALRGVSERTAQRDWDRARLHLYRSLRPSPASTDSIAP